MNSKLMLVATAIAAISIILALNRTHIFTLPPIPGSSDLLHNADIIHLNGAVGPESLAFDINGEGPYTGVADGRILKWQGSGLGWVEFAVTSSQRDGCQGSHAHELTEHICGRPLGLLFNEETGDLYIADAYMGLLLVGPGGGLASKVATQAHDIPLGFTNALDIDQRSGILYFTESSKRFGRRESISAVASGDKSGRLMKYDPKSKEITVLLDNLSFANGVALSKNGHFILIAESSSCRILKFWLETSKAGKVEVFAELPGFPDNIRRNPKGEFWVAIHARKGNFLKWLLSYPSIGNALLKLPIDISKIHSYLAKSQGSGLAMRLKEDGGVVEILEDKSGRWTFITEVLEKNGMLYIGSIRMPFVGIHKKAT